MEKLKNRLDAFSDAIIAIIITIMVLDIPPVLHDSWANYLQLGRSVGIYLISFIFIANIWYQHSTAFGEITTMTYRILILDMFFLAPLALMPLATNMMANNTTRITVILYGLLQLVVNWIFRFLAKAIIHLQYTDRAEMSSVYTKIYGNANHYLDLLSVAALIIAWFLPELALLVYLAYPILMFLLNSDARQQMYDVAALPDDQQAAFLQLDAAGQRDFWKAHQSIVTDPDADADPADDSGQAPAASEQTADTTTTAQSTEAATPTNPTKPAPAQPEGHPQAPDLAAATANWSHWLDQNVDPRRRKQMQKRMDHITPEQQQRMAAWFAQRDEITRTVKQAKQIKQAREDQRHQHRIQQRQQAREQAQAKPTAVPHDPPSQGAAKPQAPTQQAPLPPTPSASHSADPDQPAQPAREIRQNQQAKKEFRDRAKQFMSLFVEEDDDDHASKAPADEADKSTVQPPDQPGEQANEHQGVNAADTNHAVDGQPLPSRRSRRDHHE